MSEQKSKDREFIYGSTKGHIRVNKIEKNDTFNFDCMKKKILDFADCTMHFDNICLKTSKNSYIDLIDLYNLDDKDEPITIEHKGD